MDIAKTLTIDGKTVALNGERNVLDVVRRAGIEIPTFCYHSELSVYGACRLCLVDVAGRGIVASCSTPPEPGMVVRTQTAEIREMRRITIELLLANHHQGCTTCSKSATCKLLDLARRLGVDKVRFKSVARAERVDDSNPSLIRDPNKCVLCGDCVRVCSEVQGIGAIDFAHRGATSCVSPAFGHDLGQVECVFCGQCARVCPTGAIVPKPEIEAVWADLANPRKRVIAQIAPAVRVAVGEAFGLGAGSDETGRIVAALRLLGFAAVFDTSFAADLTVIEEATEFLQRAAAGKRLPQFTSCCPAWVRFAEQYYPELLPHLSSCRSPQQMFAALAREVLPKDLGVAATDLVIVSIMPCTAKKAEKLRPEFARDGRPDLEHVLTTQELIRMIEGAGIDFAALTPASLDLPLGFKTGAGVIFGNSGGVSEAVVRYAYEKVTGKPLAQVEFTALRGESGCREAVVALGDTSVRLQAVYGLRQARIVADQVKAGTSHADLIEVMACPGGCIGGAGQPVGAEPTARRQRTEGLYNVDRRLDLHKSQDNPFVQHCYATCIGAVGGPKAHELLHTHYHSRRRIQDEDVMLNAASAAQKVPVTVCVGTSCFLRGSQDLLRDLLQQVKDGGVQDRVDLRATFCHERCDRGPTVTIAGQFIEHCTPAMARAALAAALAGGVPTGAGASPCSGCRASA
jgi:NADH-quinone oxidoreductase subunit G